MRPAAGTHWWSWHALASRRATRGCGRVRRGRSGRGRVRAGRGGVPVSRGRALRPLLGALATGLASGLVAAPVAGCAPDPPPPVPRAAPVATQSPALGSGAGPTPPPSAAAPAPAGPVPVRYPHSGPGTFRYAGTAGPVLGRGGPVRRFRVAVESNLQMIGVARFAGELDTILGDQRSWIASGRVRLQRVAAGSRYDFTIHLATARTTQRMCGSGGVGGTRGYTSCRYGRHVVLNLDRWFGSVPPYTRARVPVPVYRQYLVNHEVGHELGHGHERCPGRGRPAPVMEQQTLGLRGCTPNAWPYLNGARYSGPPGSY
jgi:Protein of unknown function (DUF3152)